MFAEKWAENRMRREQLLARSHDLRQRMGQEAQVLGGPLALADRVRSGFNWLRANPQWLALPVALAVVLRPRRAVKWALKLWWGWRIWRRVQGLLPR